MMVTFPVFYVANEQDGFPLHRDDEAKGMLLFTSHKLAIEFSAQFQNVTAIPDASEMVEALREFRKRGYTHIYILSSKDGGENYAYPIDFYEAVFGNP